MHARDIMDTRFHCLHPGQTIAEAVRLFKRAGQEEGKPIFGMMVTDDQDRLVGMLSMFDILLFIQPKHMQILGEMADLSSEPLFQGLLERVKHLRVEDLMTTEVVTIKPETHIQAIAGIMIKKHVRRLPVIAEGRVAGIVYRSAVFYQLMGKFLE